MRAALVPATPPPRMTTLAAGTPGTPPSRTPSPALFLFEAMRADLDRHPPGDFAHRRQQWQAAARVGDGLIGDRDGARADQRLGQRPVGGEMKIGEQDLVAPQQLDLLRAAVP